MASLSSAAIAGALDRASAEYAANAEHARLQATIGSGAAITLLVLAFGLAYRRSLRARADAELLATENTTWPTSARRRRSRTR